MAAYSLAEILKCFPFTTSQSFCNPCCALPAHIWWLTHLRIKCFTAWMVPSAELCDKITDYDSTSLPKVQSFRDL